MDLGFFATMAQMHAQDRAAFSAAARAQQSVRQQQWHRDDADTNPFTQAPAVRSAVAAEAYQGTVIEGVSRRIESA